MCPEAVKIFHNELFESNICLIAIQIKIVWFHCAYLQVSQKKIASFVIRETYNLYNIVSTMLGQHCIGILSSQCCPNMSETRLHKKTTFAMWAQRVQIYFYRKNRFFQICLVACFLTGYIIREQSWFFLFNVGSGFHLWLLGQQWTGADIDWDITSIFSSGWWHHLCVRLTLHHIRNKRQYRIFEIL